MLRTRPKAPGAVLIGGARSTDDLVGSRTALADTLTTAGRITETTLTTATTPSRIHHPGVALTTLLPSADAHHHHTAADLLTADLLVTDRLTVDRRTVDPLAEDLLMAVPLVKGPFVADDLHQNTRQTKQKPRASVRPTITVTTTAHGGTAGTAP